MTDKTATKPTFVRIEGVKIKADWRTRYVVGSRKYKLAEAHYGAAEASRPGKRKAVATPQVDPASVPGMPAMAVMIPAEAVPVAF